MVEARDVQKLRSLTGAGIMECKKALNEVQGDFEKAVSLIKERGLLKAETKKDRAANSGVIESYVHNERVGVLVQLHCETDFVAKSAPFKELAHNLAMQIAAMAPESDELLLKQNYIRDEGTTVEALINGVIAKVGENIKVGKFIRYEI
ncbi:MAG: translation elongation factor Ts [Candidatus Colwellbacteria bacterium]|nr:translation elongation factor Ts [Candidatus Colwellbacteria bacterium]